MKIVQLCGVIEGAGITRYLIEINNGLKDAGHEVIAFEFPESDLSFTKEKINNQTLPDIKLFDYSQENIDLINSADLVFVHQFVPKKIDSLYRKKFIELVQQQITTKKALFLNDHSSTTTGFSKFYGNDILDNYDLINSFDSLVIHCDTNTYAKKLKKLLGEELFYKKYVNLHHPHKFNDDVKKTWLNVSDKHKRITYIGRWHTIKHPEQMLELKRNLKSDWEYEMRGIVRLIGLVYIPDLFYKLSDDPKLKGKKESIIGLSDLTFVPTLEWKKEQGLDKDDLLIDYKHDDKVWILGPYKREDGMYAISKSLFGGEFYRLLEANLFGNNLEYAMHEIIEQGTIAIFDKYACESIEVFENGKKTGKTIADLNICLMLDKDLNNIEQVEQQMLNLMNNPKLYNDMRERAYEFIKQHCDPVSTVNTLIDDCLKNE